MISTSGPARQQQRQRQRQLGPQRKSRCPHRKLDRLISPPTPPPAAPGSDKEGYLIANSQPYAKVLVDGKDTGKLTPIAPRDHIP